MSARVVVQVELTHTEGPVANNAEVRQTFAGDVEKGEYVVAVGLPGKPTGWARYTAKVIT